MTRKQFTDHLTNLGATRRDGEPETYTFPSLATPITITATGAYTDMGMITAFKEEDNDRT